MERFRQLTVQQKIQVISAIIVTISAFLPWVSILGITVSGVSGDGKITLILGLLTLIAFATLLGLTGGYSLSERKVLGISAVSAAICLIVALVDMNNFAGSGLWLTMLASFAWVGACGWQIFGARAPEQAQPHPEAPEQGDGGDPAS